MYVDTTIFMYAVGSESRWKDACAAILRAGVAEEVALVTSAETLQEILHRYRSIGRQKDVRVAFDLVSVSMRRILPVSYEDVDEARRLMERMAREGGTPREFQASTRDLVHAAIARRQGVREILTVDTGFAAIPGVVVVDPLEWAH
jgi:predicted nucleic acid-binding protein